MDANIDVGSNERSKEKGKNLITSLAGNIVAKGSFVSEVINKIREL